MGATLVALFFFAIVGQTVGNSLGIAELDRLRELALPYILIAFIVAAAVPFVPGVEIGFGLLLVFGAKVALEVYLSMLSALIIAFLIGRLVPQDIVAKRLRSFDVRLRLLRIRARRNDKKGRYLIGVVKHLTANRHLVLCAIPNTPGNSVLGGGGGISMLAGASRQYSLVGFGLSASIAVSPLPLLFILIG